MRTRKTKTSGNGVIWPQFLYIMVSLPVPILCKIGISNKVSRRSDEVSKKVIGWAVPVFFVWLPFAFDLEQSLHRVFAFANVRFGGGKEWFWLPVAPFVAVVMLVFQLFWLLVAAFVALLLAWFAGGCPSEPIKAICRLFH